VRNPSLVVNILTCKRRFAMLALHLASSLVALRTLLDLHRRALVITIVPGVVFLGSAGHYFLPFFALLFFSLSGSSFKGEAFGELNFAEDLASAPRFMGDLPALA
jgi:hypothetical protein